MATLEPPVTFANPENEARLQHLHEAVADPEFDYPPVSFSSVFSCKHSYVHVHCHFLSSIILRHLSGSGPRSCMAGRGSRFVMCVRQIFLVLALTVVVNSSVSGGSPCLSSVTAENHAGHVALPHPSN